MRGAAQGRALHRADADGAVTQHHHRRALGHAGVHHAVVAGGEDVAEGEHREVVRVAGERLGDDHEGAVGLGHADEVGLAALAPRRRRAAPQNGLPKMPPCSHELCRPRAQKKQVPSEKTNGADDPVADRHAAHVGADGLDDAHELMTEPRALARPRSAPLLKKCRSEPQIEALVTRTSASLPFMIVGSGTVSTRTSCGPWYRAAFTSSSRFHSFLSNP